MLSKDEQLLAYKIKVNNLENELKILRSKTDKEPLLIMALRQSGEQIKDLRHRLRVYQTFDEYERKIANE